MVDGILQGLQWLGIHWDEGPYYQTKRVELYRSAAERLIDSGRGLLLLLQQRKVRGAAEQGGGRRASAAL